ncbi:MAG: hypothetical protein KBD01_00535 [Acidobacteria bacterium]|nr:hypothetical protein [Acidobacteriota bacterium]
MIDPWAPAIFVLALLVLPWTGARAWRWVGRGLRALAARPWLSLAAVAVLSLAVNAGVALQRGWPQPAVADEFSYLLAADTFAHFRLTNPPHPLWPHFESEEIIQQPTYQSKYPPGQGLALAAGQFLGHPALGVWLSLALASAALCWMLRAWIGPRWALASGLLAPLTYAVVSGWGQTYWGGAVALLGGALLFGALRRLAREPRPAHAALLALGIAVLANSRPLEGMIATALGLGIAAPWLLRSAKLAVLARNVVLPMLLVLVPAAAAMAWYNHSVTGHATTMPYDVWYRTYIGEKGVFQGFLAKETDPEPLRVIRGSHMTRAGETPRNPERQAAKEKEMQRRWVLVNAGFYLPGVFALALLGLPWALKDRWVLLALACVVVLFVFIARGATIGAPHYSAPVAPLIVALLLTGVRRIHVLRWRGHEPGRWIVRAMAVSLVLASLVHLSGAAPGAGAAMQSRYTMYGDYRQQILGQVEARPGKHLVIVRYEPGWQASYEWVYNGADIDSGRVVWARELGPRRTAQLLEHYADRTVWLLDSETLAWGPYPGPRPEDEAVTRREEDELAAVIREFGG